MSTVNVIPATKRSVKGGGQLKGQKNIRVAAYCRVSTGDESQQTSYTNQKAFYTGYINGKEGWKIAGIYADDAISGTSRVRRKEFNRMIDDAMSGKIDYIVTKSISRFARNTVDTLNCVRQLRQQNPPVGIYFEKENIDTLDAASELVLTILSALAQEESRSISDNIRWTFQKNFQAGKPQINLKRMLGYDKGENGEWVINPAQAEIIRFIFQKYVCGHSANSIARQANDAGMRTVNGNLWTAGAVLDTLRNEKYVGDLEMQKTITKDFLTHRSVKNTGEAPKYYVKDHHIGIIDRFTWDKVQVTLSRGKVKKKKNGERAKEGPKGSPFFNLVCGAIVDGKECGEGFCRMTYSGIAKGYRDERSAGFDHRTQLEKYTYAYPVWRCRGKLRKKADEDNGLERNCNCPSTVIQECALEQSFMEMLYRMKQDYEENGENSWIETEFWHVYNEVYGQLKVNSYAIQQMEILDRQIKELEDNLEKTIERQAEAMKNEALEKHEKLNVSIAEGKIMLDNIEDDIRNSLSGIEAGKGWESDVKEGSEAAIYAELAAHLSLRLEDYQRERNTIEEEQEVTAMMKKNYNFFIKCLMEMPDINPAGMQMNINNYGAVPEGNLALVPDYLRFDRGIYAAFIQSGKVRGDEVEYLTNFGVRMKSYGNSRTLRSFLGYRRCNEEGTVDFLDAQWKVNNKKIQYRRTERKRKAAL